MSLEIFLARCQADTERLISPRAARRLSRWQDFPTEQERVDFVRRMIRTPKGMENGWTIDQAGGVSLESIVLDHEPDRFDDDDKSTAAQTLGRVNV